MQAQTRAATTGCNNAHGGALNVTQEGGRMSREKLYQIMQEATKEAAMRKLLDAHMHLEFMSEPGAFMSALAESPLTVLAMGIRPGQARARMRDMRAQGHVIPGVGIHPWLISKNSITAAEYLEGLALMKASPLIGEIGLDFGPRIVGTEPSESARVRARQLDAFDEIIDACAERARSEFADERCSDTSVLAQKSLPQAAESLAQAAESLAYTKVLSIHCVRAGRELIRILDTHHAWDNCLCICHSFCGDGNSLHELCQRGAWFSVSEQMLATKKGRAYLAQLPLNQILLETDLPRRDGEYASIDTLIRSLTRTLDEIARIKGCTNEDVYQEIQKQQELVRAVLAGSKKR